MVVVMEITWSVAPADRLISVGMLTLRREGIVVVTELSTIDVVIALMSRVPPIAIAVYNFEPACMVTRRVSLCRGGKERVTLLVDGNSCREDSKQLQNLKKLNINIRKR